MKHLTPEDLGTLAQRLDSMKQAALRDLRETEASAVTDMPAAGHEVHSNADDAEVERIDETREAEIEVDAVRLHDITLAQQRMADGSYGSCIDCGEDIPLARLTAQPIAIRCAGCQTEAERLQHR